jgi:hypothetical protein
MNRDITRHDIRQLVERGLCATTGNYRALLELFRMPQEDYKRFMNFLATHDCRAEFRDFRNGSSRAAAPLPPIVRRLPSLPQPQVPREQVDAHPSPTKVAS